MTEFTQGRSIKRVLWADDTTMAGEDDDKIVSMLVTMEDGLHCGQPWCCALFEDGSKIMINLNCSSVAMVMLD